MNEHESDTQSKAAVEGTEPTVKPSPVESANIETDDTPAAAAGQKKSKTSMYVAAIVIVAITALVVIFMLEKEGRSSTNLFESYFAAQNDGAIVAVVNGEEISGAELATSMEQFSQAAAAQGVDMNNPEAAADIRKQALEVLVNTELLKQTAREQGIEVSDEAVDERMITIQEEIGGEEALQARISELGLTQADLRSDIKEEILIQTLLDSIFAEADISVSEEEVQEVYENAAAGSDAELPPLEEVREQVETQVRSGKEQKVIDEYLSELKAGADIEIK